MAESSLRMIGNSVYWPRDTRKASARCCPSCTLHTCSDYLKRSRIIVALIQPIAKRIDSKTTVAPDSYW